MRGATAPGCVCWLCAPVLVAAALELFAVTAFVGCGVGGGAGGWAEEGAPAPAPAPVTAAAFWASRRLAVLESRKRGRAGVCALAAPATPFSPLADDEDDGVVASRPAFCEWPVLLEVGGVQLAPEAEPRRL